MKFPYRPNRNHEESKIGNDIKDSSRPIDRMGVKTKTPMIKFIPNCLPRHTMRDGENGDNRIEDDNQGHCDKDSEIKR